MDLFKRIAEWFGKPEYFDVVNIESEQAASEIKLFASNGKQRREQIFFFSVYEKDKNTTFQTVDPEGINYITIQGAEIREAEIMKQSGLYITAKILNSSGWHSDGDTVTVGPANYLGLSNTVNTGIYIVNSFMGNETWIIKNKDNRPLGNFTNIQL